MPNSNFGKKDVWQPIFEKQVKAEADLPAELLTQAAMAGPVGEIWDTPEEDEAWAHLSGLTYESV